MGRRTAILWIALAVGATVMGWLARDTFAENYGVIPALIFVWIISLIGVIPSRLQAIVAAPVIFARRYPIFYWLLLLVYASVALTIWTVKFQPTYGRWILPIEYVVLFVAAWGFVYLIAYRMDRETLQAVGAGIGKSKLAGVMVTLTTFVLLFTAAETWMRINYITTDSYGFTAMNYYWYTNFYWSRFNSLGYRDSEPLPDDPNNPIQRVAIVGDSFAVGHGMNTVDGTFPQLLESALGSGWDVNLVAQSGWDSDVQEFHLNNYPFRPNIVVLSYYLNDIDYLLSTPETNPDNNFTFIEDPYMADFIRNWFFVPNYVYYNLLQFSSPQRNSNFLNALVAAHLDESMWSRQAAQLDSFVNWTTTHDTRLIVLLWPNLAGIDVSAPALERVSVFFVERGVQVVDMSDQLRPYPVLETIVNRFDTHPGVLAHRLAADALLAAIRDAESFTHFLQVSGS